MNTSASHSSCYCLSRAFPRWYKPLNCRVKNPLNASLLHHLPLLESISQPAIRILLCWWATHDRGETPSQSPDTHFHLRDFIEPWAITKKKKKAIQFNCLYSFNIFLWCPLLISCPLSREMPSSSLSLNEESAMRQIVCTCKYVRQKMTKSAISKPK